MSFSVAKPLLAASLVATSLIYISYLWYKSREAEQVRFEIFSSNILVFIKNIIRTITPAPAAPGPLSPPPVRA